MVFVLEMIVKMLGIGFQMYFKVFINKFDFFIVIVGLLDTIASYILTYITHGHGIRAISTMRVFRLLRVFKLARIWTGFNDIIVTVFRTLAKIRTWGVLVGIFAFSYTILGMELFSRQLSFDENNKPIKGDYENGLENMKGTVPDWNFNNFSDAFLCVFIIISNDDWSTIYFDHYRTGSGWKAAIFFISLITICRFILF